MQLASALCMIAAVNGMTVDAGAGLLPYEYPMRHAVRSVSELSTPTRKTVWLLQFKGIPSFRVLVPRKPLMSELLPLVSVMGRVVNALFQLIQSVCMASRTRGAICQENPPLTIWGSTLSTWAS